jgi:hypothetical protein
MSKEAPKSADNNDPGNKSDKSNEIRNLSQNSASSSIHQSHDSSDNRSGSSTTKHANEIAGHNVINNANTPSNTSKQSELTTEKKVQPAEENNLGDSVFSKHTSKSADRVRKKSQDKRLSEKKAPSTDKNDPSKPSKRNSAHVELLPQHQTVSAPPTSTKSSFLFGLLKRSKKENKGDKSSQHKRKNNAKNGKGTAEGSTPHDHHRTAEGSTPHDHHRTAKMNDDRTRAVPSKEVKKLPNKNEKKQKEQKKTVAAVATAATYRCELSRRVERRLTGQNQKGETPRGQSQCQLSNTSQHFAFSYERFVPHGRQCANSTESALPSALRVCETH